MTDEKKPTFPVEGMETKVPKIVEKRLGYKDLIPITAAITTETRDGKVALDNFAQILKACVVLSEREGMVVLPGILSLRTVKLSNGNVRHKLKLGSLTAYDKINGMPTEPSPKTPVEAPTVKEPKVLEVVDEEDILSKIAPLKVESTIEDEPINEDEAIAVEEAPIPEAPTPSVALPITVTEAEAILPEEDEIDLIFSTSKSPVEV